MVRHRFSIICFSKIVGRLADFAASLVGRDHFAFLEEAS
jgi:hypothetical protein